MGGVVQVERKATESQLAGPMVWPSRLGAGVAAVNARLEGIAQKCVRPVSGSSLPFAARLQSVAHGLDQHDLPA